MDGLIRIEKLMSLSVAEFQASLAPLAGAALTAGQTSAGIAVEGGTVEIVYEPRPSVTYGGLLVMPRALVSLTFKDVPDAGRKAFLRRFDIAFQRGGG